MCQTSRLFHNLSPHQNNGSEQGEPHTDASSRLRLDEMFAKSKKATVMLHTEHATTAAVRTRRRKASTCVCWRRRRPAQGRCWQLGSCRPPFRGLSSHPRLLPAAGTRLSAHFLFSALCGGTKSRGSPQSGNGSGTKGCANCCAPVFCFFFESTNYEELKTKEQKKTRQPWYAVGAEALYRLHGNKRERARYRGMMSRVVVDGMFVFL